MSEFEFAAQLREQNTLPILTHVTDESTALRIAEALREGGIKIMEMPVRGAEDTRRKILACIKRIRNMDTMIIGAGTLNNAAQIEAAMAAGAQFGVSPGFTESLHNAVADAKLPFMPGVATPSEAMRVIEWGYALAKWFPAEVLGGPSELTRYSRFTDNGIAWLPTGAIEENEVPRYLSVPNVLSCGGSWVTPQNLIQNQRWSEITELARRAMR
jgi:2-dehydro-3-deoxyphosphogluconate aldolase/(4S)-4-hydroxy-2-oxoglutarate aldolase